jgi:acetyltransferase EpsM
MIHSNIFTAKGRTGSLFNEEHMDEHSGRVVIAGAGGLGSEIRDAVEANSSGNTFAGFLDDSGGGEDVIGKVNPESVPADCSLILAVGDSRLRQLLYMRFESFTRWASVIHPSSFVSPRARIGGGSYIGAFAYVGPAAVLGNHSVINIQSQVGHDARFGSFVTLSPYAATNGGVTLGQGVFLATAATVAPGLTIGDWTSVSAGSRVTKSFGPCHLLHGNPARGREIYEPPDEA